MVHSNGMPNLFEFASSELSQDAFWCWLLAWANHPDTPLGRFGLSFARQLLPKVARSREIESIEVARQFSKVDVVGLFRFTLGPPLCILLEDKIDASLTGEDQLERNKKNVLKNRSKWQGLSQVMEEGFVSVLVQSGFDYDIPVALPSFKVNGATIESWLASADPSQVGSEIVDEWVAWFRGKRERIKSLSDPDRIRKILLRVAEGDLGAELKASNWESVWGEPEFQFSLLRELFGLESKGITIAEHGRWRRITFRPQQTPELDNVLCWGVSNGGAPFCEVHFSQRERRWNGGYFYRLDWQKSGWNMTLRNYKRGKSESEMSAMREAARILREQMDKHGGFEFQNFQRNDNGYSSPLFKIDPSKSRSLQDFGDIHRASLSLFDL